MAAAGGDEEELGLKSEAGAAGPGKEPATKKHKKAEWVSPAPWRTAPPGMSRGGQWHACTCC